jgi:signal transduction histidine kinase
MGGPFLQEKTHAEIILEIRQIIKQANSAGKTKVTAALSSAAVKQLGRVWATEVVAIVRESVSNMLRHADARHGKVVLKCQAQSILLEVSDDGRGGAARGLNGSKRGHGMSNIQTRVAKMNARLTLVSEKGMGTRIRIVIPREDNHAG